MPARNTRRWRSPKSCWTPASPARSARSATRWTTRYARAPSDCSRPRPSTTAAPPGAPGQRSSGRSPDGSPGTTPPGCTPRSGTCHRLSSSKITGRLRPWPPSRRSRNQPTLRETQDGSVRTEVGDVPIETPRDRAGTFEPRLVPKGARRLDGLDAMIISLYSGGMTVRDIQAHLARTLGTELSHETIANVTDAVAEEVKA